MKYFIHLAFDGGIYSGWQRQKETANTVQEVIEKALHTMFKKNISVYGCGRTDAGVHASQYVIQIHLDEAPDFDFKFRLNKNLPDEIAVFEIFEVHNDQHCRYDAVARTYDYFIHWKKESGLIRYSSFYEGRELNFALMQKACAVLQKTNDFKALCKQPETYSNTLCTVQNCEVFINEEQGRLRFSITANRFLRGMVRLSMYYLLQVGSGKMTLSDLEATLNQQMEIKDRFSFYPNGLFLSGVEYPYLKLGKASNLIQMLKQGLE